MGGQTTRWFAVRDGQLVVVRSSSHRNREYLSYVSDYDALLRTEDHMEGSVTRTERIVVVAGDRSAAVPVPTDLDLFSRGSLAQRATAEVRAWREGGGVWVEAITTDDVSVPVAAEADDQAFLAADHLEIWCGRTDAWQLGVAVDPAGRAHARWLHAPGAAVSLHAIADGDALRVRLPDVCTGVRLSVVVSDGDGAGQQSLMGTSRVVWGEVHTFGWPAWDGVRYPPP